MLEINTTCLVPEVVLKNSVYFNIIFYIFFFKKLFLLTKNTKFIINKGHVEKFTDLIVKDTKTGQGYRADKLLEEVKNIIFVIKI